MRETGASPLIILCVMQLQLLVLVQAGGGHNRCLLGDVWEGPLQHVL
jgi:hypothetical protein